MNRVSTTVNELGEETHGNRAEVDRGHSPLPSHGSDDICLAGWRDRPINLVVYKSVLFLFFDQSEADNIADQNNSALFLDKSSKTINIICSVFSLRSQMAMLAGGVEHYFVLASGSMIMSLSLLTLAQVWKNDDKKFITLVGKGCVLFLLHFTFLFSYLYSYSDAFNWHPQTFLSVALCVDVCMHLFWYQHSQWGPR